MNAITYADPIASLLGQWASGLNLYSILFRLALALYVPRSSAVNGPISVILPDYGHLSLFILPLPQR